MDEVIETKDSHRYSNYSSTMGIIQSAVIRNPSNDELESIDNDLNTR